LERGCAQPQPPHIEKPDRLRHFSARWFRKAAALRSQYWGVTSGGNFCNLTGNFIPNTGHE